MLTDAPRSGTPSTFTPEQLCEILALACERPGQSDRPVTHWTPPELAGEAVKRASSPPSPHGRWGVLKSEAQLKPHLVRSWLTNERDKDPTAFDTAVEIVCQHYAQATTLQEQGIQAREDAHPALPLRPGQVACREMEYIRHGTQCLIANVEVATRRVVASTIGPTRTEADFVAHISQTIATDPAAPWIFIDPGDQRQRRLSGFHGDPSGPLTGCLPPHPLHLPPETYLLDEPD